MVDNKSEDDMLASKLGAAEALVLISSGWSSRSMLPAPPQSWGRRQSRSRQITLAGILQAKLEDAETRGSPKSPLVMNCATSSSTDCVEVCETSNRRPAKRKTKVVAAKEKPCTLPSMSTSSCPRRVKRKKAADKLREEEISLLFTNMGLKEEIEKLLKTIGELCTTNVSLKLKMQEKKEEKREMVEGTSVVMVPTSKRLLLPDLNEPIEQQQRLYGM